MTEKEKAEFYDALTELMQMGFDLDKNTARDMLECANYIRAEKKKRSKRGNKRDKLAS